MQPPTAERVSAGQRLFAATLMSDVERLNSLDDAWTLFLSDPENEFELQSNLIGLQSMVGDMVASFRVSAAISRGVSALTT